MTWSIKDKKMVSIIARPGKEKRQRWPHLTMASQKSGEIFLLEKNYAECHVYGLGSRLLPQILAPQWEQLKRDAEEGLWTQALTNLFPFTYMWHIIGKMSFLRFEPHNLFGVRTTTALNQAGNIKQTNQQFKNWGNAHVKPWNISQQKHQGCFCDD